MPTPSSRIQTAAPTEPGISVQPARVAPTALLLCLSIALLSACSGPLWSGETKTHAIATLRIPTAPNNLGMGVPVTGEVDFDLGWLDDQGSFVLGETDMWAPVDAQDFPPKNVGFHDDGSLRWVVDAVSSGPPNLAYHPSDLPRTIGVRVRFGSFETACEVQLEAGTNTINFHVHRSGCATGAGVFPPEP